MQFAYQVLLIPQQLTSRLFRIWIQTEKQKLEGEIKDSIARRRPIENCVRSYDNVIDNEWCNNVIDLFEKSKPEKAFNLIGRAINDKIDDCLICLTTIRQLSDIC
mgnify:CR=1 FL=1